MEGVTQGRTANFGAAEDENGAAGEIRTPDPCITNALLYRLSYCGPILRGTILKPPCIVKAPVA